MANYVNFTKKTFNPYNPKVLNEGQFSWMTQDTDQQIGSERENTIDVWMFDNQGNSWYEKRYEGYGEFGGMDYYELLARMNGYSEEDLENYKGSFKEMRQLGIDLAFDKLKTKAKGNKVLFPALVANPKFNWKRHDFTQEAESDPNQSWYQEEEYEDYYESAITKLHEDWGSSDQNIMNQSIHRDAGKPKKMPSPFDNKLRAAAEDAVDFYWDDWEEYQTDREALVDDAIRGYLRSYFRKDFDLMVRMFEPMESVKVDEGQVLLFDELNDKFDVLSTSISELMDKTEDPKWTKALGGLMKQLEKLIDTAANHDTKLGAIETNESVEVINEDWGTFGTPEAKIVIKTLNKALAKFRSDLEKAHAAYKATIKEFTTGAKQEIGNKSGFNDSEGKQAVYDYTQNTIQRALGMSEWGGALEYKVGWMYEGLTWDGLKESLDINERSINKIHKEFGQVVIDMKQTVEEWKAAEGDRKTELLTKLKALTDQKNKLTKELDDAVAGKDKDLELVIKEAEKKSINVDESLKSDVKKFIEKNEKELNGLADNDDWETIYQLLYTDFDVEPDSNKGKELKVLFGLYF